MTPRQRRFVDEYLIDLNCERAGRRAGYSRSSTRRHCPRLLRRPEIAAAIAAAMADRSRRTGITPERVMEELARIAFADMRSFVAWGPNGAVVAESAGLSPVDTAAIASVRTIRRRGNRVAVRLHDKQRALETLARIVGLPTDAFEPTPRA